MSNIKKRLEDLYAAARQAWEASRAEQPSRIPGRSWFGREERPDNAQAELAVKGFPGRREVAGTSWVWKSMRRARLCDVSERRRSVGGCGRPAADGDEVLEKYPAFQCALGFGTPLNIYYQNPWNDLEVGTPRTCYCYEDDEGREL